MWETSITGRRNGDTVQNQENLSPERIIAPPPALHWLRVSGNRIVTGAGPGTEVLLRGVGVGGWLNMENFITGYRSY
jgi:hypothetical protein